MSYDVENIIPLNLIISPSGLGFANFSTAFAFTDETDGLLDEYFAADSYRDYSDLTEVSEDFETTSEVYKIATRWFANVPKPPTLTVYMMDPYDTPLEAANKAEDVAWRYYYFFRNSDLGEASAIQLAAFGDSQKHPIPITISSSEAIDPEDDSDLGSVLQSLGNRHVFVGYKDPDSIATDPTQAYAMVQLMAAFHKFRPEGLRTAITGEYQVLPGVIGDDLSTTAYGALKSKNIVFFTQVELQGSVDNSRVINSKSMSSFGEFIDDVINLDVLQNRLQVAGYNYLANPEAVNKNGLTPRGYAGLLDALEATCKQFYNNGVLGQGLYKDINTGQEKLSKFGYVIRSSPQDALTISDSFEADRRYPDTSILTILARAGHTAAITVNVE